MKRTIKIILLIAFICCFSYIPGSTAEKKAELLYMGQASIRIVTVEGKVIYIDPYAGDQYDLPADLILVTHSHYDHNGTDKVVSRNPGCQIITWNEAVVDGIHRTFDLGYVTFMKCPMSRKWSKFTISLYH